MHDCFAIELTGECLKCFIQLTRGVPTIVVQSEALWVRIPETQVRIPSRAMGTFFPHTVSSIFRLSLTLTRTHTHTTLSLFFILTHTHTHTHCVFNFKWCIMMKFRRSHVCFFLCVCMCVQNKFVMGVGLAIMTGCVGYIAYMNATYSREETLAQANATSRRRSKWD